MVDTITNRGERETMYIPSTLYSRMARTAMPQSANFTGVYGGQFPQLTLQGHISQGPAPVSFQQSMMNLVKGVNDTTQKPDTLMKEALSGGNVDIHQVMIANSKAELAINISAQVTTKIVQAYDRITQIQV